MKTIAQRWAEASQAGEATVAALPEIQRLAFQMMFYAGYNACLLATMELANLTDDEAMAALQAQRQELLEVEAMGLRAVSGVVPS